ncbi:CHAT domain-containing protein [Mycobacterium marinum]|uniref:CHAT domain-containing protein n=1 Tax=Mycobacterium marinum TaxID=1781 RepID=UPI0035624973
MRRRTKTPHSCARAGFPRRTAEPLSLATAALLAGAHGLNAGLFALPDDQNCTGRISSAYIAEIRAGRDGSEALRRARWHYWSDPPEAVAVPGGDDTMPGRAPWAWAGLVTYG